MLKLRLKRRKLLTKLTGIRRLRRSRTKLPEESRLFVIKLPEELKLFVIKLPEES